VKFQLPRRINYLLALVATFFVMQVFFRIMFWTMVSNLPLSFDSHLMQAFWVGVRFDLRLSVLAALLTIPLLLLPRFSAVHYATLKVLLKWWVAVILFVVFIYHLMNHLLTYMFRPVHRAHGYGYPCPRPINHMNHN